MGRKVIDGVVLSIVLGLSACSSPAGVGPSSSSSTSGPSSTPSVSSSSTSGSAVLRGVPVTSFDCRPNLTQGASGVQVPAPDVSEFLLCPMPSAQHSRAATVVAGNLHFGPLLDALTATDIPRSTRRCPMYAEAVQVILAKTRTGVIRVKIPVDGCGHYQHLDVLMVARSS